MYSRQKIKKMEKMNIFDRKIMFNLWGIPPGFPQNQTPAPPPPHTHMPPFENLNGLVLVSK